MDDFDGHDRPLPCPNCQRPDYSCKCRSVPAPGADKATDELLPSRPTSLFEDMRKFIHNINQLAPNNFALADSGRVQEVAAKLLTRAAFAAVPVSEPKLDVFGDRWHSLTCDGTCSPPCKDAPQQYVWQGDPPAPLLHLTKHNGPFYACADVDAAPAPVSGMPDSQLGNLNTYWLTADGVADVFVKLSDVRSLPIPQAPTSKEVSGMPDLAKGGA